MGKSYGEQLPRVTVSGVPGRRACLELKEGQLAFRLPALFSFALHPEDKPATEAKRVADMFRLLALSQPLQNAQTPPGGQWRLKLLTGQGFGKDAR